MAYGFRIRTDSGITQIDDTFQNLAFITKGTVTMNQNGASNGNHPSQYVVYGSLTVTGRDTPLIAIRSGVPTGFRKIVNQGGGQWYYEFSFDGAYGASATVDWYLFDRPPATGGYGIRIKDASNREVFNSNNRYMRPKAFVTIPTGQPTARTTPWDYTGLPLGTYAYIPATNRMMQYSYLIFDDYFGNSQLVDGCQALTNGVRIAPAPVSTYDPYFGGTGFIPASREGFVTIIDVGGY